MRSSLQLFKEALREIFSAPKLFLSIVALPALIAAGVSTLEPALDINGAFMWNSTGQMYQYYFATAFFMLVSLIMTVALTFAAANKQLNAVAAYKMAFASALRYFGLIILSTVILIGAFILLIVPGVWLSISLMFAMYILLLRNVGIVDSLKQSYDLVKGRWWSVAGKSLMFGLLTIALVIPLYVALFVLGMFVGETVAYALESALGVLGTLLTVAFMYQFFIDLEKTRGVAPSEVTSAA